MCFLHRQHWSVLYRYWNVWLRWGNVRVISCFPVKSRRRRSDVEEDVNRQAFVFFSVDCSRLLDAEKWPNHIFISEWFFKTTSSNSQDWCWTWQKFNCIEIGCHSAWKQYCITNPSQVGRYTQRPRDNPHLRRIFNPLDSLIAHK